MPANNSGGNLIVLAVGLFIRAIIGMVLKGDDLPE